MGTLERKKLFLEATYVRDIKNVYDHLYGSLIEIRRPIDQFTPACVEIILSNSEKIKPIFWGNFSRIVNALRDFKDISDTEEYKMIKEMWTIHLPKIIPEIEILKNLLKKGFSNASLPLIKSLSEKMEFGYYFFKEYQTKVYATGFINPEERKKMDGMR
jgi:hypothetical protein